MNCIIYYNTRNWSSRDPSTPKTALQCSRCPKASSASKQGFWSSRILPPQTWYWSILACVRNWMYQRSFHFKIWNWKLQMPKASSASIQRFGSSRTLLHQFWYASIVAYADHCTFQHNKKKWKFQRSFHLTS